MTFEDFDQGLNFEDTLKKFKHKVIDIGTEEEERKRFRIFREYKIRLINENDPDTDCIYLINREQFEEKLNIFAPTESDKKLLLETIYHTLFNEISEQIEPLYQNKAEEAYPYITDFDFYFDLDSDKFTILLTFDYEPSLEVINYFKVLINAMFDQILYDLNGVLIDDDENYQSCLEFYP